MKIIISAITIYLVILFVLTVFQRKIIYYPYKLDKQFEFPMYVPQLEEVFITCEDGCTINGLFAPGREDRPAILIFHGNAGNITHRDFLLQGFNKLGYPVLLIDYHGYGKSEGTPSERNLYLDGEASLKWLLEEKNIKPEQIVIFAKSLGSGVAVEVATKNPFKGLILETPFSSIASVARSHFPYNCFPVGLLIVDKFDNISKIKEIYCPLLFMHGTRDMIVDKKESERLFEKANIPKEMYLIEGADHNNVQLVEPQKYWDKVSDWLGGLPYGYE
ncbi:MAG: alpha/beta hydrolase [Deltaproteobacteria bacterium]|nr:alpha/beta hydrolase [Deltaproteobacteria bacterium]